MKLELLDIMAHRVVDPATGLQYLRIGIDSGFSWYEPTEAGFDLINDQFDPRMDAQLEAAFQVNLTRKVASWSN